MRSVLVAVIVCLFLTSSATAAAPRAASAASSPRQVVKAISRNQSRPPHQRRAARPSAPAGGGMTPAKVEMLGLINTERARAGVGPLRVDATLNAIAQARSQDMIDRHYFSHHIPGGTGGGMVFDILDRRHVPYEMAGENIALNDYINFYSLTQTVQQTNTDLMNSPEHRANLLEPRFTKLGLGMAFEKGSGKLIVTEIFVEP